VPDAIQIQCGHGRTSDGGTAPYHDTIPFEVFFPFVLPRVEQPYFLPFMRIYAIHLCAFGTVACLTGQCKVIDIGFSTCMAWHNMVKTKPFIQRG
jgi:hypothetical protein